MKSRLVLLLVLICAMLAVNVSADTFEIPTSEISVQVDGSLDEFEWADAGHVLFKAINGEAIDVMVKYDVIEGALFFGVYVPDSSYDVYDRFFICVDNNDDIERGPQPDDFILTISRGTAYMGMYHQYYNFSRIVGTGTAWDINNLYFDSRVLAEPFRKLEWVRIETGDGWIIEMKMDLNRDQSTAFDLGLVFKQTDIDGDSETTLFQPLNQPDTINYPSNWIPATSQSYRPQAPPDTIEDTSEPKLDDPEISNDIPGQPLISIIIGVWLITLINQKKLKN